LQLFKKEKNLKKGIAFPTCISVNNCVCHFSPLKSERELVLVAGDVVKVDLGAHVDGYIAVAAHTLVVNDKADSNKVCAASFVTRHPSAAFRSRDARLT